MAIVYREKPGLILILMGLGSRVIIIIDGNIIKGLLNCLTAINKALVE